MGNLAPVPMGFSVHLARRGGGFFSRVGSMDVTITICASNKLLLYVWRAWLMFPALVLLKHGGDACGAGSLGGIG